MSPSLPVLALKAARNALFAGVVEIVGIMQRGLDAVGGLALRRDGAVGEEARAIKRDRLVQARRRVILDELDRAAAGEEREHRIRLQGRDAA